MKILILLLSLFLTHHCYGQTQVTSDTAEKDAIVAQIMEKLNLNRLVEQQIEPLISVVKKQAPLVVAEANIPAQQREKATKIIASELEAIYAPLVAVTKNITISTYTNAFSLSELKELLAFYDTPVGKKLSTELPRLQADAIKKGNVEGQRIASQAFCNGFAKLKKEGIDGGVPPFCK